MFVLYARPLDYPDQFVVRRWSIGPGDPAPQALVGAWDTTGEARAWIAENAPSLVWLEADTRDDPSIVGSWV
jgi:hypothetical protein